MGRRRGRYPSSTLSAAVVNARIASCGVGHLSPEDIANHLHNAYVDYKKFKRNPFVLKITQILKHQHLHDTDVCVPKQPKKKRKRVADASASEISSVSGSDGDDVMKSMLRAGYYRDKIHESKSKEMNLDMKVLKKEKSDENSTEPQANSTNSTNYSDEPPPRFSDFGGIKKELQELEREVILPLQNPKLLQWLNVKPVSGILLHGPPGCGKTRLAQAIAYESGLPLFQISASELVSGVSGASEEKIRELFSKAYKTAPSIVFIDEFDAIGSKRESTHSGMERRIVTQLLTCMDKSRRLVKCDRGPANSEPLERLGCYVLVIGATNRPDALDPALRRPGRFDNEILLDIPDEDARAEILSLLTKNTKLESQVDVTKIARETPGFVGADLAYLVNKAGIIAMNRLIDQRKLGICNHLEDQRFESHEDMEKLRISMVDFEEATKAVQPSLRREGFSEIPTETWEDVGGLNELRKDFERHIVGRVKYPELYEKVGVTSATGYLLFGPPGCGKTLIAKAVANEAGANFMHIKGPELLSKYVGESELHVRILFHRARSCSPCILFFDEVDALTRERGTEGGQVAERLLNQLLIELDGGEHRRGVYVIGATNRPEVVDRALLRPGRFGKPLYVPLPKPDERGLILKTLARSKPVDASVNLLDLGKSEICENLSGADLADLMEKAALALMEETRPSYEADRSVFAATKYTIKRAHFELARSRVSPSVSEEQKRHYDEISKGFGRK
ncbi:cell division control protein 48 homolog C isoform X2 [Beta vulgaris subsp. vulgaris]|uniref:cell division control protein 48 homolog C isoform X2 n=1 Tax=Beta vulgaris subsp. vulgaris TaxID=3555 RepID=UPI002036F124|nr:cell division control protein 48 homolog C isoform X2 [Beta vulgaris subsp. vulgaris]